ncbi:MAG TPA: S41 family peptidase, partial [Phycisphaerae bacterium]|nr:S41 family peptidase [Phycisphaerae bacterium]
MIQRHFKKFLQETTVIEQQRLRRFWIVLLLLGLGILGCSGLVSDHAQAKPTETVTEPAGEQESLSATKLCDKGFGQALNGDFDDALVTLQKAKKLDANASSASEAIKLLSAYIEGQQAARVQRKDEYDAAVKRVMRSLLVMDYLPGLMKTPTGEQLRKKLLVGISDAHGEASTSLVLKRTGLKDITDVIESTTDALAAAREQLEGAVKLIETDKSNYSDEFKKLAKLYSKHLQQYQDAWKSCDIKTIEDRSKEADNLQKIERDVSQSLGDLITMVSDSAWRIAIDQTRLAKDIAPEGMVLSEKPWYRLLVKEVEVFAKQAHTDAKWYDVLSAYSRLKVLDPDNLQYAESEKRAMRHVRVLRLYGTDKDTPAQDRDNWKQYVEGIDEKMVADTIPSIRGAYVTEVEYRKLLHGSLRSIKVLAETPQVTETFKGLADEKLKTDFLARIDKISTYFEKKTALNHSDLQLALSRILMASELTVEIPTGVLAREYADGFLSELDRFSSMIWPDNYPDFKKSMLGKFFGVGIQIGKEQGQPLRVSTPLAGSPAFKAGIKAEDLIIKVDGTDTAPHDVDDLVKMITGPRGTKVILTIKREGLLKPFDVPVVRDEIRIRTVKGWKMDAIGDWQFTIDPAQSIGYIRLTQFTSKTHEDLAKALGQLKSKGVHSLVLDLRFNPGGLLSSAQKVSNEFLSDGLIVSTRGRAQPLDMKRADDSGKFLTSDGDLVVLVNSFSASAAEIVSGALKDWKRCVVVGDRSYGKGSVQNVIPIRFNRALLKLTTAYYYLPSGRLLHRKNGAKVWGVDPDVAVP